MVFVSHASKSPSLIDTGHEESISMRNQYGECGGYGEN